MSPVVTEILQQIDRLPLVEQTKILRQLEQKIETATAHDAASQNSVSTSQQQWQQAIDRIHNQTPILLDLQKARIADMFAKFNEDEDEEDQQQALDIINSIPRTSI
jgi:BRCT domain type II-containing protein